MFRFVRCGPKSFLSTRPGRQRQHTDVGRYQRSRGTWALIPRLVFLHSLGSLSTLRQSVPNSQPTPFKSLGLALEKGPSEKALASSPAWRPDGDMNYLGARTHPIGHASRIPAAEVALDAKRAGVVAHRANSRVSTLVLGRGSLDFYERAGEPSQAGKRDVAWERIRSASSCHRQRRSGTSCTRRSLQFPLVCWVCEPVQLGPRAAQEVVPGRATNKSRFPGVGT